jgi:hypothetical protein
MTVPAEIYRTEILLLRKEGLPYFSALKNKYEEDKYEDF